MDCSSNVHNQFHQVMVLPKAQQEKQGRPQPLNCPRCDSSNTKFCYYNNYSFSQPRYFCKACKRYWTQGGTLRNVPVGGGCRKKQRSSSSSKRTQDHQTLTFNSNHVLSTLPTCNSNDLLTLSFPTFSNNPISHLGVDAHSMSGNINTTTINNNSNSSNAPSLLDFLRSGMLVNRSNSNNLYHGVGNEAVRNVENGAATTTTATIITTTREAQDGETKELWRCPWQINGEQSMAGVDSIRESWNGVTGFSWQELVNGSLM